MNLPDSFVLKVEQRHVEQSTFELDKEAEFKGFCEKCVIACALREAFPGKYIGVGFTAIVLGNKSYEVFRADQQKMLDITCLNRNDMRNARIPQEGIELEFAGQKI